MNGEAWKKYLLATTLFVGAAGGWSIAAAQETEDDPVVIDTTEDDVARQDKVVVTGSRIQRDEFTSVKPVQIITGDVARDVGLFDAGSILQESTAAAGLQIDTTFNGFVLDNGPGSTNVDLRGLGASRTLNLLNGRRLGAAGVEGAPSQFDFNLIPAGIVDRYDILLDGASSIYGSDAVAGVVNVILRKDFDGLELNGSITVPEEGGGDSQTLSAAWGVNSDRGFMGFAVDWSRQNNVKLNDRDVFGDCSTDVEITSDGQIRTSDITSQANFGVGLSQQPCSLAFGINRLWLDPFAARDLDGDGVFETPAEFGSFGSLYYTPGFTNVGVPGFSESSLFGIDFLDPVTGNSQVDILAPLYQANGYPQERIADVQAYVETFTAFTYGEYALGTDYNIDAYFEAFVSNRQFRQADEGSAFLNSTVPANNPFNPCNPDAGGVDCGTAFNQAVASLFGAPPSFFGLQDSYAGARPVESQFRVNLQGTDNITTAEVEYYRFVGGLKGDLPGIDFGPVNGWSWDAYLSYDRSVGQSRQIRFDDDALALSLATTIEDPNNPGQFVCGLDVDGDGIPDPGQTFPFGAINAAPDCVPVNIFSPTLYQIGGGNFATQAEYDFLRLERTFNTIVEQTLFNAVATGNLFHTPAGTAAGVIGVEYREDEIESQPDNVARTGQAFGFFSDRGATGSRDLFEVFGEIEVPLIAGQQFAEELTINASLRWTEESQFGSGATYGVNLLYRPTDWLTFRGGVGTSFRAPNLREQFITGTSGFLGLADPCVVPETALGQFNVYDPTGETRDAQTLANCVAAGVDPTTLGAGLSQVQSVEVFTAGGQGLKEETSDSSNIGIVIEQPWFDDFDLNLSVTYYDIEVEDTLVELGAGFVIDQCYNERPDQTSPLCPLITRSAATGLITEVDTPFVNQDRELVRGIDYNIFYEQDFEAFERELTVGVDLRANQTIARDTTVRAPGGPPVTFSFEGQLYSEEWRAQLRAFADYDDFRLTWNTSFIQGAQQPNSDPLSGAGVQTCFGAAAGDVDCRDVDFTDDYFLHNLSLRYSGETFVIVGGVRNLFDEKPDQVDPGEVFEIPGTTMPFNQDFLGRRFFVTVSKDF